MCTQKVNLLRKYVEAICSVNNMALLRTANELLSESSGNIVDFSSDIEAEYQENNLHMYLSKGRKLPKEVAAKVLDNYAPIPLMVILQAYVSNEHYNLVEEKLQKLRSELKSFEALIDINNIDEIANVAISAESEYNKFDPIIQRAERLYAAMMTTLKQGVKRSTKKSCRMLENDRNDIAKIILKLRRILEDLKAISDFEDILHWHHPCGYINHSNDIQACNVERIVAESVFGVKTRSGASSQIEELPDIFDDGAFQSPFSAKLTEFRMENVKLLPYIERYPQYKMLCDLYYMGNEINTEFLFYRPADRTDGKTYHPYIDRYENQLKACSMDIGNPTFSDTPSDHENS